MQVKNVKTKETTKNVQNVKALIEKHRKLALANQQGNCGPIGGWGN